MTEEERLKLETEKARLDLQKAQIELEIAKVRQKPRVTYHTVRRKRPSRRTWCDWLEDGCDIF